MEKNNYDSLDVNNVMSTLQKMIACCICQERLVMPMQCLECQNLFCQKCISNWNSVSNTCPFKCHKPEFKPCRIMENILTSLESSKIQNTKNLLIVLILFLLFQIQMKKFMKKNISN